LNDVFQMFYRAIWLTMFDARHDVKHQSLATTSFRIDLHQTNNIFQYITIMESIFSILKVK
jgi:hypothetical protein